MPRIDGSAGPIPVSGSSTSSGKSVATVQLGESKLSEVAQRLGVDPDSLHNANPQIADANKLKVGQELNLPEFQPAQNLKQNDRDAVCKARVHSPACHARRSGTPWQRTRCRRAFRPATCPRFPVARGRSILSS